MKKILSHLAVFLFFIFGVLFVDWWALSFNFEALQEYIIPGIIFGMVGFLFFEIAVLIEKKFEANNQ